VIEPFAEQAWAEGHAKLSAELGRFVRWLRRDKSENESRQVTPPPAGEQPLPGTPAD
jgi:hypothetical protein